MNPPFGTGVVEPFLVAAARAANDGFGAVAVFLPARFSARWWQRHVDGVAFEVWLAPRRVSLERIRGGKPVPSSAQYEAAVVVYRPGIPHRTNYEIRRDLRVK